MKTILLTTIFSFLQMLLPCDQPYLRAQATQRSSYEVNSDEKLPYDVERALKVLIQKELKMAIQSEMLKQQLACRYDFNIDSLYMEIDDCNLKYICSSSLKRFLVKCQIYPNDELLFALVRRLDLDSDAKLTRAEF